MGFQRGLMVMAAMLAVGGLSGCGDGSKGKDPSAPVSGATAKQTGPAVGSKNFGPASRLLRPEGNASVATFQKATRGLDDETRKKVSLLLFCDSRSHPPKGVEDFLKHRAEVVDGIVRTARTDPAAVEECSKSLPEPSGSAAPAARQ